MGARVYGDWEDDDAVAARLKGISDVGGSLRPEMPKDLAWSTMSASFVFVCDGIQFHSFMRLIEFALRRSTSPLLTTPMCVLKVLVGLGSALMSRCSALLMS